MNELEKSKRSREELDEMIAQVIGDPSPDEIDARAVGFERVVMEMIEVIRTEPLEVIELFNDIVFRPVVLDERVAALLEPGDVFLSSLGLREGKWHVIYLSPSYEEEVVIEDGLEADREDLM